jgi:hypothetical protein
MRLFDAGVTAAGGFLSAADRTAHARQALETATIKLNGVKSSGDQQLSEQLLQQADEARERSASAIEDAENAYSVLRLLVPAVAAPARHYLDYCIQTVDRPDSNRVERQRAREMVEETLRGTFGGNLLNNWIFPAQALKRQPSRRWKIPLARRPEQDNSAGAPRER